MADYDILQDESGVPEYEERMLKMACDDLSAAKSDMRDFHNMCNERRELYFNALRFEDMRKKKLIPTTFMQEQVDAFVGWGAEKLFYKDRPCTIVPVEETDEGDAEAKQKMMDWQDYRDKMYSKTKLALKDCSLYRVGVVQVDYDEDIRSRPVGKERPLPLEIDGEIQLNPMTAEPFPTIDPVSGQPVMESYLEVVDIPVYKGPIVKRIDPRDFYVKRDKTRYDDEPIMITSTLTKKTIMRGKQYINKNRVDVIAAQLSENGSDTSESQVEKNSIKGIGTGRATGKGHMDYFEWQGMSGKRELYEYLGYPKEIIGEIGKDEECPVIVGILNEKLVIRLEEGPFDGRSSNVVVGIIEEDEGQMIGTSLSDKIIAVTRAKDILGGQHLENLKQSVDAGSVINKDVIVGGGVEGTDGPLINKAGWVLEVSGNVNDAYKRIEQPRVAPDIMAYSDRLEQEGQGASGVGEYVQSSGDPAADTLGEANIVMGQQTIRLNAYLKTFEETWVQPVYELRNQINIQFLDQPYVYGIIGKSAVEWRTIEPDQIRASVDFLCESSSRETNRGVITQQILQLTQLSKDMTINGIPMPHRIDRLLDQLCASGFSWSRDKIEQYLPLLKYERTNPDIDIDQMLVESFLMKLGLEQAALLAGATMPGATGGPGEQLPQPTNEQELNQSMGQRNQTQVGSL